MKFELMPHQIKTLEFFKTKKKCLDFSMMGTGKSLPAISLLSELSKSGKQSIYVCPAFLVYNIANEFEKFYPSTQVKIIDYKVSKWSWDNCNIAIMSYDRMKRTPQAFKDISAVIFDECHKITNIKSKVTNAAHNLTDGNSRLEYLIGMTGTPIVNKVGEMFALFALCDSTGKFLQTYKSLWNFQNYFCYQTERRIGGRRIVEFYGLRQERRSELVKWFKMLAIRHTLSDIGRLPDMVFSHVRIGCGTITNKHTAELLQLWESYKKISNSASEDYRKSYSAKKAFFADLKSKGTVEFVKEVLEGTDEFILVLSDHRSTVEKVSQALDAPKIMGGTDKEKRFEIVDKFQNGELGRVLVGTIGSLGVGLTLTRASIIVFNDMAWTPAANNQAIGRIMRLNQTRNCKVYSLVANAVDERIAEKNVSKQEIITDTVESFTKE